MPPPQQGPQQSLPPWSEQPPIAQYPQQSYPPQQYPPQYPQRPPQPGGPQNGPQQSQDDGNAPDHGVARIAFMNGNVSVRRGDSGDLVAAIMNVPLTIGDRLVTADGARAEVQFDAVNLIRLGPATEVRFSELAYHRYQIQVATGTTSFRVLRDNDAQIEISTPTVSVRPATKGVYRVTVKPDGTSEITVRSGDAEIFGPKGSEQLHAGHTMLTRGSPNDPEFQVVSTSPEDEFDHWAASRDRIYLNARSPQYVSPDVYGTEDMDQNGRWVNDGSYGNVWVPQVDPGWAPYQCGRWVWLDFYGWTWQPCEAWGWAPFHYGRWYMGVYGWSWWPGPVVATAFWHPALVGFFGFGAPGIGVGFGFGFANVGWVPLAPFERFQAWYGPGYYGGFRGGFNVVQNANVGSVYRNARVANGVSAMHAGEFGRANVSSANLVRPTAGEMARAGAVRGALPMTPSRESTQFASHAASTAGMPHTGDSGHFFSHNAPSQTNHIPFEQQRQAMSAATQRSFGGGAASSNMNGGWRPASSAGSSAGARGASPQSSGGWQRFDPSTRSSAAQGGSGYSSQSRGPQPVRISPQIVQPRSGSSTSAARGGSSRGTTSSGRSGGSAGHGGSGHR
jgi:hypothetical protein